MNIYINPPDHCDICKDKITNTFYDGKTLSGLWANMCSNCYIDHGFGPDYVTGYIKTEQGFKSTKPFERLEV